MKRETVVTIFVRHQGGCRLEGKNFARGCECPKWLRWSVDGKQYRQTTGTRSWERAEEIRKETEKELRAGREPLNVGPEEERRTLERAYRLFLSEKDTEGVSRDVYKKYDREIGRFVKFCEGHGKFYPSDINKELMTEFRAGWEADYPSSATRQMVQARLKQFLRYCQEAGWMHRVPKFKAIKVDVAPTMPLTKEEYQQLLDSIPSLFAVVQNGKRTFDVEKASRVRALIQLMRHTGLAIRDAVTLERSELIEDKGKGIWRVATSRQKTGTPVSVPLPPLIANELIKVLNGNPKYVFWSGGGLEQSAVTNWQHDLRYLLRAVFGAQTHFTPHCLRDTFAVEMLSAGIPIEEVSKLLGHTSVRTTERSYAPWVRARQDRLDSLVVATWQAQP